MDLEPSGECALVTGGSRHIGRATSVCRPPNADVALLGRSRKTIDAAGSELAAQISGSLFHAEMNTEVMSYISYEREVVSGIRAERWGNISGLAARTTGNAVDSVRNIVAALTRNPVDELGAAGVNVTAVSHGVTRSERTAPLVASRARALGVPPQAIEKQMATESSIQQSVEARDVANVAAFLCSMKLLAIGSDAIVVGGRTPRAIHD